MSIVGQLLLRKAHSLGNSELESLSRLARFLQCYTFHHMSSTSLLELEFGAVLFALKLQVALDSSAWFWITEKHYGLPCHLSYLLFFVALHDIHPLVVPTLYLHDLRRSSQANRWLRRTHVL